MLFTRGDHFVCIKPQVSSHVDNVVLIDDDSNNDNNDEETDNDASNSNDLEEMKDRLTGMGILSLSTGPTFRHRRNI